MSGGFRGSVGPLPRRTFKGVRWRCYVEKSRNIQVWRVIVERQEWTEVRSAHPDAGWYRVEEGVYLPIRFANRYRAESLAKIINGFFKVHRWLERDDG